MRKDKDKNIAYNCYKINKQDGFLEKTPWAAQGDGNNLPCQLNKGTAFNAVPLRTPNKEHFTKSKLALLKRIA